MSAPLFSSVRSGDTILVGEKELCKVLSFTGGSRDPEAPLLFQVANVDTGEIKHVHAAELPLSNFLPTVENYEKKVSKKNFRSHGTGKKRWKGCCFSRWKTY